jgi:hypothetical protein
MPDASIKDAKGDSVKRKIAVRQSEAPALPFLRTPLSRVLEIEIGEVHVSFVEDVNAIVGIVVDLVVKLGVRRLYTFVHAEFVPVGSVGGIERAAAVVLGIALS